MGIEFDPFAQFQDFAHPEKFVSASWLSARLGTDGLRVVESDEDAFLYDIGHIPGAVRIDWHRDLNDPTVRDFIDGEAFAKLMNDKGIGRDDTVVVYGDRNNWWAAYTAWVFELFGHPDVRLLDGGRDAWMGEERDTSYAVPDYPSRNYPVVERQDKPRRAFVDDVRTRSKNHLLIDARGPEFYAGAEHLTQKEPNCSSPVQRHGHIPGAVNHPWGASVYPNGRVKDRASIAEAYAHTLATVDTDNPSVIAYCSNGQSAAHTCFILRNVLGLEDVALYDGSWVEWGNMIRMPIERDAEL